MRVQIKDQFDIKRIREFLSETAKSTALCLCVRNGSYSKQLMLAFGDRSLQIPVDKAEVGSVELNKAALKDLFEMFAYNNPIDIQTEKDQVLFKQRGFVRSLPVLTEELGEVFSSSPQGMMGKALKEEKRRLLRRVNAINKELGA